MIFIKHFFAVYAIYNESIYEVRLIFIAHLLVWNAASHVKGADITFRELYREGRARRVMAAVTVRDSSVWSIVGMAEDGVEDLPGASSRTRYLNYYEATMIDACWGELVCIHGMYLEEQVRTKTKRTLDISGIIFREF